MRLVASYTMHCDLPVSAGEVLNGNRRSIFRFLLLICKPFIGNFDYGYEHILDKYSRFDNGLKTGMSV